MGYHAATKHDAAVARNRLNYKITVIKYVLAILQQKQMPESRSSIAAVLEIDELIDQRYVLHPPGTEAGLQILVGDRGQSP